MLWDQQLDYIAPLDIGSRGGIDLDVYIDTGVSKG